MSEPHRPLQDKKGGRLKPDKTAKEGEDPFKVSGREILANMDKNTKQALWQAKRGVRKTVSLLGAVSYFAVASLALILVSRDSCTCAGQFDNLREGGINYTRKLCSCYRNSGCSSSGAVYRSRSGDCDRIRSGDSVGLGGGARPGGARPGKGHWDLLRSGGGDGFEILGSGSGDRLGLVRGEGLRPVGGDGLRGGGGNGLGPGSGGRLRLGGSDRLGDGQIGYGSDHLGCDGSDRIGCKGSNQLGLGSDNQIKGDGLTWAGDGTKDGGGPVGHRSRQGAGGGGYSDDSRGSDSGWTKADSEAVTEVGSRADQGEESGSALLARIVFDKDNPAGRSNTLHSVVLLRE